MKRKKIYIFLILLIIILTLVIFGLRQYTILKKFTIILDTWNKSNNIYYVENIGNEYIVEYYQLDNKILEKYKGIDFDKSIYTYYDTKEKITLDNMNKKIESITKDEKNTFEVVTVCSDYLCNQFYNSKKLFYFINTTKFYGKECYELKINKNNSIYIDKKSYYPLGIKTIIQDNKIENVRLELKFNVVKETDFKIDDLSSYESINK